MSSSIWFDCADARGLCHFVSQPPEVDITGAVGDHGIPLPLLRSLICASFTDLHLYPQMQPPALTKPGQLQATMTSKLSWMQPVGSFLRHYLTPMVF